MFIDSHAHLTTPSLAADLEGILGRAKEAGIDGVVNIATTPEELEAGLALSQIHPWIVQTGATTPHDVEKQGEAHFEAFARAAQEGKLVAVGETGLDYYYAHSPKEKQQEFFRRYLALARSCNLPVVIHCRDAFGDFFALIDAEFQDRAGVLHCFTGTSEEAREVVKRGWYLSISGIVTFKKSDQLRQVAREVPLEQLLIETDAPYLAPQSRRGKTNEPAYLIETATCIAQERGISLEELAQATAKNARNLFKIK